MGIVYGAIALRIALKGGQGKRSVIASGTMLHPTGIAG
jgi:hypothetical protein